MEVRVIHNEVKQNPIFERKLNNLTNRKKTQAVWKNITESQCSGHCRKISDRGQGQMAEYVRGAKQQFAEHRRETHKTNRGPPPAPLFQTVADIVDLYKGCSSFVGISGGMETSISKQTGVLFYNSKLISTDPPPSESCPSHQLTNIPITFILSA